MLVERPAISNSTDQSPSNLAAKTEPERAATRDRGWVGWILSWTRWDWFALVLPLLALFPLLAAEAKILWSKQHMQFFPLAIAAVVWFVTHEGSSGSIPTPRRRRIALVGVWANLALVPMTSIIYSSWLAHLIGVQALFFWMLGKFGNLSIVRMLGISGLALITVPFPFNGDQELVRALQRISSFACSRMMDAMQILHVRTGNILEITRKQLFVEEACSGVDSQYALMAVAGVLLLYGRASVPVSILTIVTVPIWAILGNILRIISIVIGIEYFGIDLSTGWQHMLLGLFAFGMAAWAHWSSVQFLNWLEWTFVPPHAPQQTTADMSKDLHRQPISIPRWAIAIASASLFFAPLGWALNGSGIFKDSIPDISEDFISTLPGNQSSMARVFGSDGTRFETVRRSRGHQEGQCSQVWRITKSDGLRILSMDLPFRGGHPLWVCYRGTGWTLSSQRTIDMFSRRLNRNWPVHEMLMRSPEGHWATLHFVHVDRSGTPFDNSATRLMDSLENREKLTHWRDQIVRILSEKFAMFTSKQEVLPVTVQFQLLTQGLEVPSADEIEETRRQFQACREQFLIEMQPAFERMQREFE